MDILELIVKILGTISFIILIALLFALPTMWLWNYLMPDIFSLKEINVVQALCMNLLCGMLFKSNSSSSKK